MPHIEVVRLLAPRRSKIHKHAKRWQSTVPEEAPAAPGFFRTRCQSKTCVIFIVLLEILVVGTAAYVVGDARHCVVQFTAFALCLGVSLGVSDSLLLCRRTSLPNKSSYGLNAARFALPRQYVRVCRPSRNRTGRARRKRAAHIQTTLCHSLPFVRERTASLAYRAVLCPKGRGRINAMCGDGQRSGHGSIGVAPNSIAWWCRFKVSCGHQSELPAHLRHGDHTWR